MSEKQRRHLHAGLAIFFAVQIPIAIGAQVLYPNLFESVWKQFDLPFAVRNCRHTLGQPRG